MFMIIKFAPFMIIRNEREYIEWPIKFLWEKIDKFYVFDTGSTDGTPDFLRSMFGSKIVYEKIRDIPDHFYYKEGGIDKNWDEVAIRNEVMEKMEKVEADYLINLDGDDIIVPELLNLINDNYPDYDLYSTEGFDIANPTTFYHHRDKVQIENLGECNGMVPRIWKRELGVRWKINPWQVDRVIKKIQPNPTLHCILDIDSKTTQIPIKGQYRFHLHYTYGWKRNKDREYFKKSVWRGDTGKITYHFPPWFTDPLLKILEKEIDLPWKIK